MKYKSQLYIITHGTHDSAGNLIGDPERLDIPVHSFEVDGGANRKINLSSTNEIAISSEFEQARINKNITFYIPPTKDFLALKLIDLRKNGPETFDITFVISMYSKGKVIQTLRISTDVAWFLRLPAPEGGTPPLLKAMVRFHSVQLLHGQYDPKRKKLVHTQI